jgi:hypothetical protein
MKQEEIFRLSQTFEHALHELRTNGKSRTERERAQQWADDLATALHQTPAFHRYVDATMRAATDAMIENVPLMEVICTAIRCGVELGLVAARADQSVRADEVLQ